MTRQTAIAEKHLLSWTTQRGHLQLFDTRDSPRVVGSVQILPDCLISDHILYRNDAIVAFENGMVQVIDLRTMSPITSYRDEGLSTIRNIDLYGDSWCGFYGKGLRALRLPPLLRTATISELCRIDAWGNEIWHGTNIAEDTILAATK